jgi:NADH-quinone oxidoreductase subunit C
MSDVTTCLKFNKLSKTAIEARKEDIEVQQRALRLLQDKFADKILDSQVFRDDITITIGPEAVSDVLAMLRDNSELKYNHLSSITGIDYSRFDKPGSWGDIRFGIVYNLFSYEKRANFAVRVVAEEDATVPSVVELWHTANWQEREIYDLLGVTFTGHPDLRRIMLYDDFEGEHPLRKDYPLKGKGERDRSWRHVRRQADMEVE